MADNFSLGVATLGTAVSLEGLNKGLGQAEQETQQKAGGLGGFFGRAFEFATGGLIQQGIQTLTSTIGGALGGMIGDAREAGQVMAQTEAVIKSTGGAAGLTAQEIADLASSLSAASGKSLFGDDDIQRGENLLATFTNIGKDVFPTATQAMVDMAQAMGTDVKGGAIQLGKALNDPIAGISALSRVGVTFTDQQKGQIKAMVEAGNVAGAQKVILAELNKEFGGSAAAAAAADGGWAQFKDRMGEAGESIGTALLPLLGQLAGFLNDTLAPAIETGARMLADFLGSPEVAAGLAVLSSGISLVAGLISDIVSEGGDLGVFADDVREVFGIDLSPFVDMLRTVQGAVQGMIQSAAATFSDANTPIEGFIAVLSQISPAFALLSGVVQETLPAILAIVTSVFGDLVAFFQANGATMLAEAQTTWTSIHDTVLSLVQPLADVVNAVLAQILAFWQANGKDILAFVGQTWSEINQIIQVAMQLIQATIVPILVAIAGFIAAHGTQIQAILSNTWHAAAAIIDAALTLIKGILTVALDLIHGRWSQAWEDIKAMSARIVQDIITVIQSGIGNIVTLFGGLASQVLGVLQALPAQAAAIGTQIMQAIGNAISAAASWLAGLVSDAVSGAIEAGKRMMRDAGVPGFGGGVTGFGGGLAIVGEQGPEMVALPSGSSVFTASETRQLLSGAGGGGQTLIFNIDARGSTMTDSQFEASVRRVLNEVGTSALSRSRTGR